MTIENYIEIEEKLAEIFKKDARTARVKGKDTTIVVEENAHALTDITPFIGIYLDSWESPPEEEIIRAGTSGSLKTFLDLEIVLYEFNLENREACRRRNELLKIVKTVLKANRKIDNTVLMTQFMGGSFENSKVDGEEGFYKGVTLKLRCEIRE